ncbi:hypothetical protein, partial [Salmonella enterica]|uniref:hypothetical protein n=1 Tax=Salmonella enterica TaxID=28901 RepID=UPI00329A12D6
EDVVFQLVEVCRSEQVEEVVLLELEEVYRLELVEVYRLEQVGLRELEGACTPGTVAEEVSCRWEGLLDNGGG